MVRFCGLSGLFLLVNLCVGFAGFEKKDFCMKVIDKVKELAGLKVREKDLRHASELRKVSAVSVAAGKKASFADKVKDGGYIVVSQVYDLEGEVVTLKKGTVLDFRGGSLSNGVLIGNQSVIVAYEKVFNKVSVKGSWSCQGNVLWFAKGSDIEILDSGVCHITNKIDVADDVQRALSSSFRELVFPCLAFYVGKTLELNTEKRLVFEGTSLKQGVAFCNSTVNGASVIFTDKNITLLRIGVEEGLYSNQNTVKIEGGNFDVSLCQDYTVNCIEVKTDRGEKMWGAEIGSTVIGRQGSMKGCGIAINPVENRTNGGYVTQVRVRSNISCFGVGIKATNYMDWSTGTYYNWCTDVQIDSNIVDCPLAVDTNCDCSIAGMIQAGYFWDKRENTIPLIRIGGDRASVSANIFDIRRPAGQKWSNWYALEITMANASVVANGLFQAFVRLSKNLGQEVVTGQKQAFFY